MRNFDANNKILILNFKISDISKNFEIFEIFIFIFSHLILKIIIIIIFSNTILSNEVTIYNNNLFIKNIVEEFFIFWQKNDFVDLLKQK